MILGLIRFGRYPKGGCDDQNGIKQCGTTRATTVLDEFMASAVRLVWIGQDDRRRCDVSCRSVGAGRYRTDCCEDAPLRVAEYGG